MNWKSVKYYFMKCKLYALSFTFSICPGTPFFLHF
jgi:hypothetical protein